LDEEDLITVNLLLIFSSSLLPNLRKYKEKEEGDEDRFFIWACFEEDGSDTSKSNERGDENNGDDLVDLDKDEEERVMGEEEEDEEDDEDERKGEEERVMGEEEEDEEEKPVDEDENDGADDGDSVDFLNRGEEEKPVDEDKDDGIDEGDELEYESEEGEV
jgi:hypothetical protein